MSLKLYRVTCRGMTTSSTGVAHGIAYVLAVDPSEAYRIVRDDLNKRDLGFTKDRERSEERRVGKECRIGCKF